MRLTFEVDGKVEFDRAFHRVGEKLEDLRPVWPAIEREFYAIEDEQFKSEGAKGRGGKWKPLSRPYAQQKANKYGVQPILRATGRLEKSLTSKTSDTRVVMEKQEFGIGTTLFYAAYHQSGTKKMPARPVISFSNETRTRLTKTMQKSLLAELRSDRNITRVLEVD